MIMSQQEELQVHQGQNVESIQQFQQKKFEKKLLKRQVILNKCCFYLGILKYFFQFLGICLLLVLFRSYIFQWIMLIAIYLVYFWFLFCISSMMYLPLALMKQCYFQFYNGMFLHFIITNKFNLFGFVLSTSFSEITGYYLFKQILTDDSKLIEQFTTKTIIWILMVVYSMTASISYWFHQKLNFGSIIRVCGTVRKKFVGFNLIVYLIKTNICTICIDKEATYLNVVCFHLCVCETCYKQMKSIRPICRTQGNFRKVFKA